MFDFLKKSKPALAPAQQPKQVIRIVERELGALTLAEWCSNQGLAEQAKSALTSPLLRRMLQVLHNSHPAFQVMVQGDTNARAMQQARCEGYTMALSDLESMGTYIPAPEQIEAEFAAEEVPDNLVKEFMADGRKTA